MFRNYLTIVYRNTLRHKGYAVINVLGLAVGMACCILILLYVQDELGYDKYASRHDRIYRLAMSIKTVDRAETRTARSPTAWGWMLTDAFPEVEEYARIKAPLVSWQVTYVEGNKRFNEPGFYFADPGMLDMFDFKLTHGDANTALNAPNTVVMTETTAARYFGDEEALGKVIRIDNTYDLTVTGVMEDVPRNSHMTFGFLGSFETLNVNPIYGGTDYGRNTQNFVPDLYTYLLLADGYPPESLDPKLAEFIESRYGPVLNQINAQIEAVLQPLTSIHLHSNLDGELGANSDIVYIYIFSAVAFFLLLIACINFMNLATARSAGRAREVGIRKVLGAFRVQLIGQFMGESTIMAVLSLILAVGLVYAFLPAFNALAGKDLVFAFDDMSMAFGLIGIVVLAGALAGSYPALFLSSFQPVSVLKGSSRAGAVNTNLRKILVVLQFVISVVFIIGTGAVADQMRFVQDKHLGFDKEQLVVMPLGDPRQRLIYNAYKDKIADSSQRIGRHGGKRNAGRPGERHPLHAGRRAGRGTGPHQQHVDRSRLHPNDGHRTHCGTRFLQILPHGYAAGVRDQRGRREMARLGRRPARQENPPGELQRRPGHRRRAGLPRAVAAQRHRTDDAATGARPGPAPLSRDQDRAG